MKTVLITGGTTRLGKAIADWLRENGWRVLTSSHREDSGADIIADLSSEHGAVQLYARALELLAGNPPDALVNNAAVFSGEDLAVRRINLETPKKLTVLMASREHGVGAVVNILDATAGNAGVGAPAAYLESKAELRAYTATSAAIFASTLRVNAVGPGSVLPPSDIHIKAGERLLNHRATPQDVAAAVAFLLSAEATTGCIIPVDSGESL